MTSLQLIFIVGIAAAGLVNVVRAVVPTLWLLVKPLSCDLCMSWWSSLAISTACSAANPMTLLGWSVASLGGTAVSLVLVKLVALLSQDRIDSTQVAGLAASSDTGAAEEENSHVR